MVLSPMILKPPSILDLTNNPAQLDDDAFRRSVLTNGVRVITEHLPHTYSATMGIWIGDGSRHDPAKTAGQAHFLEHVLFKDGLAAEDVRLAGLRDSLGGYMNAFTSHETTCFYVSLIGSDAAVGMELLGRLISGANFSLDDVERERDVILAEINRAKDNPGETARELCMQAAWGQHPMVHPIVGESHTVKAITHTSLLARRETRYVADNTIIVAAGNIDHDLLHRLGEQWLVNYHPADLPFQGSAPEFTTGIRTQEIATTQVYLCLAIPGLPDSSEEFTLLNLFASLLGDSASSRLRKRVREKLGLAYHIRASAMGCSDGGLLFIQTAVTPDKAQQCYQQIMEELSTCVSRGFTQEEIDVARKRLMTSILLGMENTRARMVRLARIELRNGCLVGPDRMIQNLSQIDADLFNAWLQKAVSLRIALGAVGPTDSLERLRSEVQTWPLG